MNIKNHLKSLAQPLFDFAKGLASTATNPIVAPHIAARDKAMAGVADNSGKIFQANAKAFVLDYLRKHGSSPGEEITDACKQTGIIPHDDRAFGPVYMSLARDGFIFKCGTCIRKKGHGTCGGNVWSLKL